MSTYQIGKDVQGILSRLDKLELQQNTRGELRRTPNISNSWNRLPSNVLAEIESQEAGVDFAAQGTTFTAPFGYSDTWDSGSGGNLFVNGKAKADASTGVCEISIYSGDDLSKNVDDSDRASRFMEAYFGFAYRNSHAAGRLRVTAEYFISHTRMADYLQDESGSSAIDFEDFQELKINLYKEIGDEMVRFGTTVGASSPTALETKIAKCRWDLDEGTGDKKCKTEKKDFAKTVNLSSATDLEKGQLANIFVGLWSGVTLWTNDYAFDTSNYCKVRLDKVTVSIV